MNNFLFFPSKLNCIFYLQDILIEAKGASRKKSVESDRHCEFINISQEMLSDS